MIFRVNYLKEESLSIFKFKDIKNNTPMCLTRNTQIHNCQVLGVFCELRNYYRYKKTIIIPINEVLRVTDGVRRRPWPFANPLLPALPNLHQLFLLFFVFLSHFSFFLHHSFYPFLQGFFFFFMLLLFCQLNSGSRAIPLIYFCGILCLENLESHIVRQSDYQNKECHIHIALLYSLPCRVYLCNLI